MELRNIQDSIQTIVDAIAAVLKIEVEVADQHLFRVAGTGLIKKKIMKSMHREDLVFQACLTSGQTLVIEKPGFEEVCRNCRHFENCIETGEICAPIIVNNETIGVIGLISFTVKQQERLFSERQINIAFLEKMAEVIATKMCEYTYYEQKIEHERNISTLLHYIDDGIIMLNNDHHLQYSSPMTKELLNIEQDKPIPSSIIEQLVDQQAHVKDSGDLVTLYVEDTPHTFFVTYQTIEYDTKQRSTMIRLENPSKISSQAHEISSKVFTTNELIGQHPTMLAIKEVITHIKDSKNPVFLHGATGTSKSFIAKYIHATSKRAKKSYQRINCSLLAPEQLELDLFGTSEEPGALELADEGTLFIEEIEHLPLQLQIKLLQFLNNQKIFSRNTFYTPNTRLIISANTDIQPLIAQGLFRQDLFYKLSIIPIQMPTLQERQTDIPLLVHAFLKKYSHLHKKKFQVEETALHALARYSWPGNLQELENAINYAVTYDKRPMLSLKSFPHYIIEATAQQAENNSLNLQDIERQTIQKAIEEVCLRGLKKEHAAQLLGISRATFYRKIKDYQLQTEKSPPNPIKIRSDFITI